MAETVMPGDCPRSTAGDSPRSMAPFGHVSVVGSGRRGGGYDRDVAALAAVALGLAGHGPKLLVPGTSLGGIRIGDPPARVTQLWGTRHGVCRNCARTTWVFNERPFEPQGLAVTFRNRRVSGIYTLWQPSGWKTSDGLGTGDAAAAVTATYGALQRVPCVGYDTYMLGRDTRIYVRDDAVWGFGLTRPGAPACRDARA